MEDEQGGKVIEGHPAVYNQKTAIGNWFYEIIERGAFDGADMTDVPLLVNHNMKQIPVARSRRNNGNSTMQLSLDSKGIAIRATLDTENNADARQLYSAVSRGDMDGMSFAFRVDKEEWEDLESDMPTRRIKAISKVFEVSAVIWPAYSDTDISARAGAGVLESAQRALENARAKGRRIGRPQLSKEDIPSLFLRLTAGAGGYKIVRLCLGVTISALFCTMGFTYAGLVLILGYDFRAILPTRFTQFLAMTPVYCVLVCCLYFSPVTSFLRRTADICDPFA